MNGPLHKGVTLTPEQVKIVGYALDDAKLYRVAEQTGCADCTATERVTGGQQGACERHRPINGLIDAYDALAETLFGDDHGLWVTP